MKQLQGIALVAIIWWLISIAVDLPIVPSPDKVVFRIADIFAAKIMVHGAYSLCRIFMGIIIAVIIAYPLGVCMGYFNGLDKLLSPILYLTYPVPKIALLPVVMVLFGVGEISKLIMIFLIITFQVVITVRDAVRSIAPELYYTLLSMGASWRQLVQHIIVPSTLPNFISALRIAMATAVSVLFFTEAYGTTYGMGYFIMDSFLRVNYLDMYAGIIVLSLIGLILFSLLDWLEAKLCRWQSS